MGLENNHGDCERYCDPGKESSLAIQAAIDAMGISLFSLHPDLTISSMNRSAEHMAGRPPDACIGKYCNLIIGNFENGSGDVVTQAVITAMPQTGEGVLSRNGFSNPVKYAVSPIKSTKGDVTGVIKVLVDQKDQKTALGVFTRLAEDIRDGNFSARADPAQMSGDFKVMAEAVNSILDTLTIPIGQIGNTIHQISSGEVPGMIPVTCPGPLGTAATDINNLISLIQTRNQDIANLSLALERGDLSGRLDDTKYAGANGKLIREINALLEAIIAPFNIAVSYIGQISAGTLPESISREYPGEYGRLVRGLNDLTNVVNMRNADLKMLTEAAVRGDLATRVDTTKYPGYNGKMLDGVNNVLDAVITPMRMAARYIEMISNGEIPSPITDTYQGDFNEIRTNLNLLIKTVLMRNEDIRMLTTAAHEGRLSVRADVTKYSGANGKMIEGINGMLDIMAAPVQETLRLSKEYANCNFTARMDDRLEFSGDFRALKEALENIGSKVSEAVGEISRVSENYSKGHLETRFNEKLEIKGDFVIIRDSLNNIGQGISDVLSHISRQVNELAAGAEEAHASAEEVTAGAVQVSKSSQAVSLNAENCDSELSQTLKAMEDLSRTVSEVAQKTDAIAKMALSTNVLSEQGAGAAEAVEKEMAGITRATSDVNSIIQEIKSQMDQIGKIIGLISDLASQTNLLALNAAIEAARAGDAGRGFAVVATEVKSLAQESRSSAEEIADMISLLQKQSEKANDAIKIAENEVKKGNAALTDTLKIFNQMNSSLGEISATIVGVAAATEEQASSLHEITATVNEVSGLVRSTAREAGESAAASEEASAAVEQITNVIGNVNTIVDSVSRSISRFTY